MGIRIRTQTRHVGRILFCICLCIWDSFFNTSYVTFGSTQNEIKNVLNKAPPKFPCSGQDAINVGFKEGKDVGRAINNVRNWWIKNDCKKSYNDCKEILKAEYNKL